MPNCSIMFLWSCAVALACSSFGGLGAQNERRGGATKQANENLCKKERAYHAGAILKNRT